MCKIPVHTTRSRLKVDANLHLGVETGLELKMLLIGSGAMAGPQQKE